MMKFDGCILGTLESERSDRCREHVIIGIVELVYRICMNKEK